MRAFLFLRFRYHTLHVHANYAKHCALQIYFHNEDHKKYEAPSRARRGKKDFWICPSAKAYEYGGISRKVHPCLLSTDLKEAC
jgi:hypothetical protein